ncbi:hypothetical protein HDU81_004395 [Chytriomyces hyalinus]|nr:hypothetical protein HDU81_004395 [Chytriomyces hyalinus]
MDAIYMHTAPSSSGAHGPMHNHDTHTHDHSSLLPPIAVYSFVHSLEYRSALGDSTQTPKATSMRSGQSVLDLFPTPEHPVSTTNAVDAIILSFLAFNSSYSLSLTRKDDLFADTADWLLIDGKPVDRIALPHVYEGHLTGYPHSTSARIVMHHHENENTVFEGSFTTPKDGIMNIKSIDSYLRSKRPQDVEIATPLARSESTRDSRMILFHDSGLEPPSLRGFTGVIQKRDNRVVTKADASCAIDFHHPHNYMALQRRQDHFGLLLDHEMVKNSKPPGYNGSAIDYSYMKFGRRQSTTAVPGCSTTKQFLFMGAAADCNYVNHYGSTAKALTQILSDFNQASAAYEAAFNVGLAIIKVDIRSSCQSGQENGLNVNWNQQCRDTYKISDRLSDFSQWRGSKDGSTPDNAGLWHLMTGCTTAISGQAVGIAWLQTVCLQTANPQSDTVNGGSDFVSGTAVSSIVAVEWKVVAHEVGHNFGAHHDCTGSTCPSPGTAVCCECSPTCDCQGQFIMHPTDNAVTSAFSPCSKKDICKTLGDVARYSCLKPPGALKSLSNNICGNGVKEGNEECDCGGPDCGDKDGCCDGATCKLKAGAVCDDSNDDCCTKCQFKSKGVVCRASTGVCDYPEVCPGNNGTCPDNLFVPNGQPCSGGTGGTVCASGICTSRDSQCKSSAYSITTTGVCPGTNTQCQLLCTGPGGQCFQLAGNMIDGTPCGYAGSCAQGSCQESGWFGQFVDLFTANLQISIPIAVTLGFLILCAISNCITCCVRQYKYGSTKRPARRPRPQELPVVVGPAATIPYNNTAQPYQSGAYQSGVSYQRGNNAAVYPAVNVPLQERQGNTFLPSEESSGGAGRGSGAGRGAGRGDGSARNNWVDASKYNGVQ